MADQVNSGCFLFRHPDSLCLALIRACCPRRKIAWTETSSEA